MAFLLSPSRKPYLVYLKTLRIGQGRERGRMFGQKKVSHRNYQEFIPERKSHLLLAHGNLFTCVAKFLILISGRY